MDEKALLDAMRAMIREELEPVNIRLGGMDKRFDGIDKRLDILQEDIEQIKEDAAVTREAVNTLGDWAEAAADVLKIKYPIKV